MIKTLFSFNFKKFCIFLIFIVSALLSFWFSEKKYYILCLLTIILIIVFFFLSLEKSNISPKSLILASVLSSIAATSRILFSMLPQVKPMSAIIIISGICLGPKLGFLTGTLSAFTSNFFLGQGIWTPWQMITFGIMGFMAGLIFKSTPPKKLCIYIYGAIAAIFYGFIMNFSSYLLFTDTISFNALLAYLFSGFLVDIIHSISTVIFLFLLFDPISKQIKRLLNK